MPNFEVCEKSNVDIKSSGFNFFIELDHCKSIPQIYYYNNLPLPFVFYKTEFRKRIIIIILKQEAGRTRSNLPSGIKLNIIIRFILLIS